VQEGSKCDSALPVFEYNIKEERFPPYSLVFRFVCSHPDADGEVECKGGLNASRALLVFERILETEGRPQYSLVRGSSVGTSARRV